MFKVLLVIGDAAEVFDTLYPLHRIREGGYEVHVAAPEKRTYHLVMHDTHPDWDITVESPGYRLAADVAFRDIRAEDYVGMVISGGRAPEYLRYDPDLMRLVRHFFERNLPVASVCHGIEVLATAGVIRGREVTTVRKCRFDAEVCGALYVDREVVVSGNLVTSRTWHDNHAWMREYMKLLTRYRLSRGATPPPAPPRAAPPNGAVQRTEEVSRSPGVPVTITPEATEFIASLGMHAEFEEMIEHARETLPGLKEIHVTLEDDPGGVRGGAPLIVIRAHRQNPGPALDQPDWDYDAWQASRFPPEVCLNFLVTSTYEAATDGR